MKVVICGAGLTGLALAHRLAAYGAETVVLERSPGPRAQGYMIDFFGPGYDAIAAMGLLPAVEEVAYRIGEATLIDARGRARARIRPEQFTSGAPLLDLMRPDLERVLREHLPPAVDLRYGARLTAVTDHGTGVRAGLGDGTVLDADLLVGADGVHSTVRRLAFGPEDRYLRYLGFHTAAFVFDSPEIHAAVRGRAVLTDSVDHQMGFYGLRDGRVAAFAVHRTPDPAMPADSRTAVRAVNADLGRIAAIAIAHCPPAAEIYYDQVAQIHLPTWHTGRVVLAGDAAYAVSLLAGQGASLGIAGAYVLADHLAHAPTIDAALAAYERRWRPIAEEKQRVGRSAARWFLPASRTQLLARRAMLRIARLPAVDRLIATGLAGKPTAPLPRAAVPHR